MREDLVDEGEVDVKVLIDLDEGIDHAVEVRREETDELLGLGDEQRLGVEDCLGIYVIEVLHAAVGGGVHGTRSSLGLASDRSSIVVPAPLSLLPQDGDPLNLLDCCLCFFLLVRGQRLQH